MTCPACGLANEPGARVCRNCGLPIASATDPLRGVVPGRVDMPSTQRSGLSATFGLLLVVGLLLVGGTLAVSGGGILSSGGRLVAQAGETPSTTPASVQRGEDVPIIDGADEPPAEETVQADKVGTTFDYTCESGAIRDLSRSRWFLSEVAAGSRSDEGGRYAQIYWTMTRQGTKKVKNGTTVSMEWTTPKEVQQRFGIERVTGTRAIVVTFDGPVDISTGSVIEDLALEGEGIEQVKKIQMFEDEEGTVRTVIGLRGDSCARMEARNWGGKAKTRNARVSLEVEDFGAVE